MVSFLIERAPTHAWRARTIEMLPDICCEGKRGEPPEEVVEYLASAIAEFETRIDDRAGVIWQPECVMLACCLGAAE
jgi:hypothetical protein